jgi:crotonobetainyl-CoA:carnitine CoA-transferase CaiB-like acyl-CoA transferase
VLVTPPYLSQDGSTPWVGGGESHGLLAATTGVAYSQASYDDVPVDLVEPHLLYLQGLWAATVLTAGLIERQRSGRGQVLTVGGVHGMAEGATASLVHVPGTPRMHQPGGPGGPVPFYRPYRCADGQWLFLACLTPNFFLRAFELLDLLDLFADPRLEGDPVAMLYPQNVPWVVERVAAVFATQDRDWWLDRLAEAGLPAAPLADRDDWLDHPQLAAIGMRVEVDDPVRGKVVMPGVPLVLADTPGGVQGPAPAPARPGDEPPWSPRQELSHAPRVGSWGARVRRGGPLEGLRVLDLGSIIAGTYACSLLAELGADVVKVEPPSGDGMRGLMLGFAGFHKGKRGVVLDLRTPGGHDAFLRLVRDADVVVDNFRPGVLERLGVDYLSLRVVNPTVTTVSVTGFGEGGPMGANPGFDPVLQAMSGMMTAQGGDDDPVFLTVPVNDVASAAMAALGACLAVLARERTGSGQRVWTSLAGQSALLQSGEIVQFAGRPPAPRGGRDHPGPHVADRFYRTADGWVRLEAHTAEGITALAGVVGDWPDDPDRQLQAVQAHFAARPTSHVLTELTSAGIPAVAARAVVDLPDDPVLIDGHVLHRIPVAGEAGSLWTVGRMARLSRTEVSEVLCVPGLGEHTRSVLAEVGLTDVQVDQLLAEAAAAVGGPYAV